MRKIMIAAAALLMSTAAGAQPAGPLASIEAFARAFNAGDIKAVTALHATGDLTIIDDVPPHVWRGPKAVAAWLASLAAFDKQQGRTDGAVVMGPPQVTTTTGTRAYAVVPTTYSFKQNGVPMREAASITFALTQQAGKWKVAAWSFNGTEPRPARTPAG